jgi:hypothetical protein
MLQPLTMTDDDCSPWPPVLQFTPEVQSGIDAAAALAFGRYWDTPIGELPLEALRCELFHYAPEILAA